MLGWIIGGLVVLTSPLWYERYKAWMERAILEEQAKGPRGPFGM